MGLCYVKGPIKSIILLLLFSLFFFYLIDNKINETKSFWPTDLDANYWSPTFDIKKSTVMYLGDNVCLLPRYITVDFQIFFFHQRPQ